MKKIISIITFFFILFIANTVYGAGSVSLSSNKTGVNVGEEFSVSITLSNATVASLTARVTVDTSKVDYVSGPSNSSFRNGRAIYTWTDPNGGETPKTGGIIAIFKFRAKAAGSAGFSVSGDFYTPEETSVNPSFIGTTVTIVEEAPPVEDTPTIPETPPIVETPSPEVPSVPETPTVPETPITPETPNTNPNTPQTPSTPSSPGNTNNTGGNANLSSNNNLKSLSLDVEGLTPEFNPNVTQYVLVVNETITDIDVLAVAEDINSSIQITGNNGLQMGSNTIQIIVTAQNGNKKTYTISVTKTEEANRSNSFLENLAIENVTLTPEFRYDIFEYSADIPNEQENLNVLAVPQREGARATIEGHENLQYGDNTITITVTAEDGITTSSYIVKAYRKTEEEQRQEELEQVLAEQKQVKEAEKEQEEIVFANALLATVITIGVAILIGVLVAKYNKEKKSEVRRRRQEPR